MKKEAYEALVEEMSKQLAEKILSEEGDISKRARTIDADIAVIVGEIGLEATKQVLEKTCEEKMAKKKPKGRKRTEKA
jgi:hypothetical protein